MPSFTRTGAVAAEQIQENDVVIAFMGPTGVGKSTFIDLLTNQENKRAGSSLKSHTSKVDTHTMQMDFNNTTTRIVLVDTPGFDDTNRSDMEVLEMVGNWLEETYKNKVKLTGILYLHRITDNRMGGSPLKNLRMFGKLCGDIAMNQVVLVTTMWEKLYENKSVGEQRETELKDVFWRPMIERGSGVERLEKATSDAAWEIIRKLIDRKNERHSVLIQEELVDIGLKLNETGAGKVLYNSLQTLLSQQKDTLTALMQQAGLSNDPTISKELEAELRRIEKELQKTFSDIESLKIPIWQRIKRIFSPRARARPVKIS